MTTVAENASAFCHAVEARSREHHEAMEAALDKGWLSIAGSVLRMELDSMIRVIWLLDHPESRGQILAACVAGEGFKAGRVSVRDIVMVNHAVSSHGWVRRVYDFGNRFVHLTNAHGYAERDPFQAYEHRAEVIEYINDYHGGKIPGRPLDDRSSLIDLVPYAPHVLEKITSNLDSYLSRLRARCV